MLNVLTILTFWYKFDSQQVKENLTSNTAKTYISNYWKLLTNANGLSKYFIFLHKFSTILLLCQVLWNNASYETSYFSLGFEFWTWHSYTFHWLGKVHMLCHQYFHLKMAFVNICHQEWIPILDEIIFTRDNLPPLLRKKSCHQHQVHHILIKKDPRPLSDLTNYNKLKQKTKPWSKKLKFAKSTYNGNVEYSAFLIHVGSRQLPT